MKFTPINYTCYNCGKKLSARWSFGWQGKKSLDLTHTESNNRYCDSKRPTAVAYSLTAAVEELERALISERGQNPQPQDTIHLSPEKSD